MGFWIEFRSDSMFRTSEKNEKSQGKHSIESVGDIDGMVA